MTNEGTPKAVRSSPKMSPAIAPAAMARRIATISGSPFCTNATARIADARPLTDPTDRSISPISSTSTIPIAMVPTAAHCIVRFTRLVLDRKVGFRDLERRPDHDEPDEHGDRAEVAGPHPAHDLREPAADAARRLARSSC